MKATAEHTKNAVIAKLISWGNNEEKVKDMVEKYFKYAFEHFLDNTNKEVRKYLNATIFPTLTNPLIVIKEIYKGKNALTFYKPFYDKNDENKLIHIAMYKLFEDKDGFYKFKTIFELSSLSKVDKIITASDFDTVYFKFDSKNKVATGTSPKP